MGRKLNLSGAAAVPLICTLLAGFVTMSSGAAEAGSASGGGGNAQVCFVDATIPNKLRDSLSHGGGWIDSSDINPKTVVSVKMFDYLDALTPVGEPGHTVTPKVIEALPGEDPKAYVERIKKRFTTLLPGALREVHVGEVDLAEFKEFKDGLGPINDVGAGANYESSKCVRVTIIGQYTKGGETYIGYDPRFYNLPKRIFSETNRGISYLHEYAYYEPHHTQPTSDNTRTFVAKMITQKVILEEVVTALESIDSTYSDDNFYAKLTKQLLVSAGEKNYSNLSHSYISLSECKDLKVKLSENLKTWYDQTGRQIVLEYPGVPTEVLRDIDTMITGYLHLEGLDDNKDYTYCIFHIDFGASFWFDFQVP